MKTMTLIFWLFWNLKLKEFGSSSDVLERQTACLDHVWFINVWRHYRPRPWSMLVTDHSFLSLSLSLSLSIKVTSKPLIISIHTSSPQITSNKPIKSTWMFIIHNYSRCSILIDPELFYITLMTTKTPIIKNHETTQKKVQINTNLIVIVIFF
jgi:hypothetical protein